MEPNEAGPLQPELKRAFAAIDAYLDIDSPGAAPPTLDQIRDVATPHGEWAVEKPEPAREPSEPFHPSQEHVFLQLLESAVRR